MSVVNSLVARVVDVLLLPFENQPPLVGLAVVSFLSAVGILTVVRATSDQPRLAAVKQALQACVLEIRLFNDDGPAMLRAVAEMVRHNLTYLRLSMVPALWAAIPLGLLVAQLQFYYGYDGIAVGHQALVTVRLKDSPTRAGPSAPVLTAPPGIRIETPAVWIPTLREAAWRIAAEQSGNYELGVEVLGRAFTKTVRVSSAIVRRSPLRQPRGFVTQLLYPAEPPLPDDSQVESIAVTYPRRGVSVLGWDVNWMIVFFTLSMGFTVGLRRRFGVVL